MRDSGRAMDPVSTAPVVSPMAKGTSIVRANVHICKSDENASNSSTVYKNAQINTLT